MTACLLFTLLTGPLMLPVQFKQEPTIAQVQRAARQTLKRERQDGRSWLLRARLSALLPTTFSVRYGKDFTLDLTVTEKGEQLTNRLGSDRGNKLQFNAEWDLSKLIYHPAELQISRQRLSVARRRLERLLLVTRLYFERRRKQLVLLDRRFAGRRLLVRLEIMQLTASLDLLTGYRFSKRWLGRTLP